MFFLGQKEANFGKDAQLGIIFDNPMYSNLLKGALKGLKYVAIATFDVKLGIITKMFEDWVLKKEEEYKAEQEKKKKEREEMGLY